MAHIFDLPAEVRMEIFRRLLLTRYTERAAPYKPHIPHALQPAILRVCYQFRQEAGDVLYRENVLIHVITNYPNLVYDLRTAGLSSIAIGHQAKVFAHYSLRVHLLFQGLRLDDYHFMIAVEDLPLFCSLFWLLKVRRDHQLSLHLTVLSPFHDLPPSIAKQESLILPFHQLWHIACAAIDGFVDHGIAARLRAALTGKIPQCPEKLHEFAQSLKQNGDQCTLARDHFGGAINYYQAFAVCQEILRTLRHTYLFPLTNRHIARDLTARELCLMSNITIAFYKLTAWEDAEEMADATIWMCLQFGQTRDLVIAYFRRALARKEQGNYNGARLDFRSAKIHCGNLQNRFHVEQYIRMEEDAAFEAGDEADLHPQLKQARAYFGFI